VLHPPVVCAGAQHAERLVAAMVANRRLARPEPPAVVRLEALGDVHELMSAREVILVATGAAQADALHAVLTDPASLLRAHPRLTAVCDPPAATRLPGAERRAGDHVAIVLGHREPGISVEHRISHESLERLQRAERLIQRRPARAVVLTGYTSTGGLSEAEQMGQRWADTAVPCLLEVAGRNTAENATRSLPLVLALGGIRHVSVVSSAWHIRTPWFFAPYRRYGLDADWVREWRGGSYWRMLADEVHKARAAPRDRRRAWRSVGEIQA
jgi:hypothetical protein